MSFAPRFLLLLTLIIFPWGCGQDTDIAPDEATQTGLDFSDENLAGELDDAQAQKLLRHLERGEVQEATALLAQLNLDEPKTKKCVLLASLYLLNGNESAARALITSSWPAGAMWFDRLKARHAHNSLLGDLTTYLGQRLQRPKGIQSPTQPSSYSGAALPQMPTPTLGYDLIPLQRSEVNTPLNVAFEVDCQTDITIDGQGTVDLATEATKKMAKRSPRPARPP